VVSFRCLGAIIGLVLVAAAPAAQTDACRDALAEAEARYVQGAFDDVEPALTPCLDTGDAPVAAFRLLTLARLRQGDITGAKLTLLRILALEPDYRPDLVQDPPDYVALIRVVRGQLGPADAGQPDPASSDPVLPDLAPSPVRPAAALPGPETAAPETPSRPAAPQLAEPAASPLGFRFWGGAGSYGGERGSVGTDALDDLIKNSGPVFGIGLTVDLARRLRLFADVEGGYYSTLDTPRELAAPNSPVFEDSADLDPWVRTATVGFHLHLRPAGASPYLLAGGGIAMGGRGGFQVAGIGTAGAGLEVPLFEFVNVYLEGGAMVAAPDRALDAAANPESGVDVFSGVRFGLRYTASGD
jgi:hypothetical protein